MTFGEIRNESEIIIPVRSVMLGSNAAFADKLKRVFDKLGAPWRAITRMYGSSPLELHAVPSVCAARVVMVDPNEEALEHPLLYAFLMTEETAASLRVPELPAVPGRYPWLAHVLNCPDYLFVPFSSRYAGIGARTGSIASTLLVNSTFSGLAAGDAAAVVQAMESNGGLVIPAGESFSYAKAAMERAEIPAKFISEKLIHPQAFRQFPIGL